VKITLALCVFMFCFAWLAINFSHDAVKNRELDVQLEMAKAIGKFGRPGFDLDGSDQSGKHERRKGDKL
jgi:hypothetical protein